MSDSGAARHRASILPRTLRPDLGRLMPRDPQNDDGPLLVLTLFALVVRYRGLVAFAALVLGVEPLLRMLSGALKLIETLGTAPGAALTEVMGLIALLVLWLALCPAKDRLARED